LPDLTFSEAVAKSFQESGITTPLRKVWWTLTSLVGCLPRIVYFVAMVSITVEKIIGDADHLSWWQITLYWGVFWAASWLWATLANLLLRWGLWVAK
jgi:hypothetical protein